MNTDRWPDIERVLDRALESAPADWPRILDEACGADDALRHEVEALLAWHERSRGILDSGAGAVAAAMVRELEEPGATDPLVGAQLGPWRVEREVGRGGMSRVYLAERVDGAFAQRAAVKVLRAGLDTPADAQRFHGERQILASLQHPYIARLLDGGVTPDGRPYLVLEYIEGVPLTTWCEQRGLDTSARLRLMLSVAEATQAAHRQLVVHRDLKPSNILVGADGRPRLLDFGIAKILGPALDAGGDTTATRQRWLSPAYAAPEQFRGAPVTTATDVYQLGAILYELLTGHRPFGDGRERPLDGRPARDEAAPPSTHRPALRGDLDAVVLKALRPEPDARYATVADFAADIRRVLDGEPVAARLGSRAYRWRRFARRQAVPLALAAAAVLAMLIYAGTLAVQNRRIARALAEATTEREKAEQVTGFLLGLFEANDPRAGRSDTVSARTLLARGEARANALERQPAVQAAMLEVIGQVRSSLGTYAEARPSIERALAIRRRVLGEAHPDVARSLATLARVDEQEGRYAEAERGYRDALARLRAHPGDTAHVTQETMFYLAGVLHSLGRIREAESLFGVWERAALQRPARRDAQLAARLALLGDYADGGMLGDTVAARRAERYLREALAIRRELYGPAHADVALTAFEVARRLWIQRRRSEGDSIATGALAVLRRLYPEGHPDLAAALLDYGNELVTRQQAAAALPTFREAVAMARRYYGEPHLIYGYYLHHYGVALRDAAEFREAETVLREADARLRAAEGEGSVFAQRARVALGGVLGELGRFAEGEALLVAAFRQLEATRGLAHRQTRITLRQLIKLHERAKHDAEAARYRALLATADSLRRARPAAP